MYCTKAPPRIIPNPAPTEAPAAKVAKATDLHFDGGGKEWANIPNFVEVQLNIDNRRTASLTAAGMIAASPAPCTPRKKS